MIMSYNPYRENSIEDVLSPSLTCLHPQPLYSNTIGIYKPLGPCEDSNCYVCHQGSGISIQAKQHHQDLLTRLPGTTLCALMGRLHNARGSFGEKFRFYYQDAFALGTARDVIYIPWSKDPGCGSGEIHVVLGAPLPDLERLRNHGIGSAYDDYKWYSNTQQVFQSAPWSFKDGPWWKYIKTTLNPSLTREVETAETEQRAKLLSMKSFQIKYESDKLAVWANKHRNDK